MGRAPCCDKANVKKGPWSPEEDAKLKEYIEKYGTGNNWIALPQKAGLRRCGKSCRLRWLNYLRPNIKHGEFTDEEDRIICCLYANIGSRWSIIAAQLPGRTDNDIKNYWNTKLKKKLMAIANPLQQQQQQYPYNKIKTPTTDMYHPILNQPSSSSLLSSVVSSSSPYNYYYAPPPLSSSTKTTTTTTLSFGGFDQTAAARSISAPSSTLLANLTPATMCSSSPPVFQDGGYLSSPVQNYLMFGGTAADQPSCSSSDGSCNNNNTNQVNQDDQFGSSINDHQNKGNNDIFKKYFYNNYYNNYESIEEDQKNILDMDYNNAAATVGASSTGLAEKCSNMFLGGDVTPLTLTDSLDFGLEEIKQLISSNSSHDDSINVCTSNSFLCDENKTAAAAAAGEESSGVMMYY